MPQDISQLDMFDRFYDQLIAAGVDAKSASFLLGRVVNRVTTLALAQASQELGEEKVKSLGVPTEETADEWQASFEELYEQETGKDFLDLFTSIAEQQVTEFEQA